MKNFTCDEMSGQLVDYVDGELSPEQTRGVEDHLASCTDCAKLVKDTIHRFVQYLSFQRI